MTSIKQIKANKKNALKGGVKTQEGKEKVKYNALKHGLSSNSYDDKLEENLINEYKVTGTLEKIIVKNICIAKERYEKGVNLENKLFNHILNPSRYEKTYKSQEELTKYLKKKEITNTFFNSNLIDGAEPDFDYERVEGVEFDYDLEKLRYLIDVVGKYNYQNEIRINKNIFGLLQLVK